VLSDRVALWTERLRNQDPHRLTIVAEDRTLLGFANTFFEADPKWGALLENLHVSAGHHRQGVGSRLLALTAEAVVRRREATGLYLWVLEQNADARAFYEARGGTPAGREAAAAPGGVADRLSGSPVRLRYAWPDPAALTVFR
jgi:GNAT superfamily N-acetyltransferase